MINRFTLKFKDNKIEKEFNEWYLQDDVSVFQYALLAGIVAYCAFIPLDMVLYEGKTVSQFFVLRITISVLVFIIYLFARKGIDTPKQYQIYAISTAILCFGSTIVFTFFDNVDEFYLYTGNSILIVFVFTLLSIRFNRIRFLAIFFIIVHLVALYINFRFTIENFTHQAYGIIAMTMVGLLANYIIELQRRQNYLNQRVIEEQKTALQNSIDEKDNLLKILKEQNIELDAFNHSVSHDLKAPLRNINAFSSILEKRYKDKLDKNGLEYLDFIVQGTKKMNTLVNDLLAYSKVRKTELKIEMVDINKMVDSVYFEQIRAIENTPIFTKTDLPSIKGDKVLLKQVWQNLISNAIKYSSKQEVIKLTISATTTDEIVTYAIKDNGIGFDMKYAEKLFEVFRRLHTDKDFSGSGVGLSLVHRIIEKHNGKIWAESEPNKGSTFYFSIPVT